MDKETWIHVSIGQQRLFLMQAGCSLRDYPVSTAKNGPGERMGSECTPRGWHRIRAKIGDNRPQGAVFVGRRWTGEIHSPALGRQHPQRDWILSRILWLSGLEPGVNRLGDVDTMRRYIYIHGAPDELINGQPDSHGCVRMRNADVMDLFDQVEVGTRVRID